MASLLATKRRNLEASIAQHGSVLVAYSGGVDSACLAEVAHLVLGTDSLAVTAVSPSLARSERHRAASLATERGWSHQEVSTRELGNDSYVRNEGDRCYWCKTELFEVLEPLAAARRATMLVGTNVDDLGDYRPGLQAANEHGVAAPLADAGFTKVEVRELSAELGLPTADKPAAPCLASRLAYGVEVTEERLRRIDEAEEIVRAMGFDVFRVRDHGELARIEVSADAIEDAASRRAELSERLGRLGWKYVTLDLGGFRSGSLNDVLPLPGFGKKNGPSPR
jgi:uncharacterized protein